TARRSPKGIPTRCVKTRESLKPIWVREHGRNMLRVSDLHVYYDTIHALKGVSFNVEKGELVTLLGANGAGQTTTLKTLSGLLRPRSGTVELEGAALEHVAPHEMRAR